MSSAQQLLLDTATEYFGRRGYEGVSTRDIAAASGTAMSSITYHFGGKEGLYLAVADHIAAQISAAMAPAVAAARHAADSGTRGEATESLLTMLDAVARIMLTSKSVAWSNFIAREQQSPTAAFDRLYAGAMQGLTEIFAALVARARPDLDGRSVRISAILLFGQALILRTSIAAVLRVLDVERIDAETEAMLLARLRAHTMCILSENAP